MKNNNYLIFFLTFIFFLNGCQDVKKGFSGKKLDEGNEFLVIKKNPLEVPPNFNELPTPKSNNSNLEKDIIESDNSENDFKKLIEKKENKKNEVNSKKNNNNLEEKILDKIK